MLFCLLFAVTWGQGGGCVRKVWRYAICGIVDNEANKGAVGHAGVLFSVDELTFSQYIFARLLCLFPKLGLCVGYTFPKRSC